MSRSYAASTGGTTKASIDGLTPGDAAYVHQTASTTKYYEIQVTYSYDKVNDTTQILGPSSSLHFHRMISVSP